MLKQRIITALLLLPFVFGTILFLPLEYFSIVWALVMTIAAYEWLKLSNVKKVLPLVIGLIALNAVFMLVWFYPVSHLSVEWFILIAWLFIVVSFTGDPVARLQKCSATLYSIIGLLVGCVVILPTWFSLVVLHEHNPWMVLHVFGIVWIADTGAYFSGKLFGKRKLAPAISPGKSWEGVIGALVAVTLYSIVVSFWWREGIEQIQWLFVFICVVAAIASVAGDLLESVFKRASGVKDSGKILPGHGGVMDRLDSIMAAGPVFTAGYYLAGWL